MQFDSLYDLLFLLGAHYLFFLSFAQNYKSKCSTLGNIKHDAYIDNHAFYTSMDKQVFQIAFLLLI